MTSLNKNLKNRRLLVSAIALAVVIGGFALLSGPSKAKEDKMAAMPPVAVDVQTVAAQNVQVWTSFSGRMRAVDYAEIRPEVSGRIVDIRFQDGQIVKAGDTIIVIDPSPYEAAVARAEADLASAKTNAAFAKTEMDRADGMVKTQAIAQRVVDERANANRVAQAAVKSADAALRRAKLDLDHAYVKAPIGGLISRAEITTGNLVQTGPGAPVLTTIVSNNGIYADFEVDEQTYMKSVHSNASTNDKQQQIPVEITAPGDSVYRGTIYSFDNHIDPASGTIRARAKFANADGSLMPGMFVSVRLASSSGDKAILIPERAIGSDQSKKFVFVVTPDNKVAYQEVTLGEATGGQRIVTSGLEPGARVIVDGLQHVKPDMVVEPHEKEMASSQQTKPAQKKIAAK